MGSAHVTRPVCDAPPRQAVHRQSSQVGAAKVCEMAEDDELDNFMVEIDILTEMDHKHVVKLLDAYLQRKQLWVSGGARSMPICRGSSSG